MGHMGHRDTAKPAALESWRYGDPAEVAERIELQANAKAAREMQKRAEQERIKAKVFRKGHK